MTTATGKPPTSEGQGVGFLEGLLVIFGIGAEEEGCGCLGGLFVLLGVGAIIAFLVGYWHFVLIGIAIAIGITIVRWVAT